jgi:D-glycero-D-manno-heptose 1,7-bisphosphate phosphatase
MLEEELIVFDLDGTLVVPGSGATFRRHPADWRWLQGRREEVLGLVRKGVKVVVATNQAGVAFGHYEEAALDAELEKAAREAGAVRYYVCFHHPQSPLERYRLDCAGRKPNPGIILAAIKDCGADPARTLVVGDQPEDAATAKAAGVRFCVADNYFWLTPCAGCPRGVSEFIPPGVS